jgi:hypothetical protein
MILFPVVSCCLNQFLQYMIEDGESGELWQLCKCLNCGEEWTLGRADGGLGPNTDN